MKVSVSGPALAALDRYPYRCLEQITSRALPLLYVSELAAAAHVAVEANSEERIRAAIESLLTRQDSTGSFGLWSVGGDDLWLNSYVTDFLTGAREQKSDPGRNGGSDLAYGLYVLVRNGLAPVGDLRYVADAKLDA